MAILLVVMYHCHLGVSGGYVGVDVFFVISGFLITSQLVRELTSTGTISFRGFYARRVRRILPAATLTTVITVIAVGVILAPLPAVRVFGDARMAALFGANVHFAAQDANYFNASLAPSPIQHYWSLSVEEQFYFVWPLLLLASSLAWLGVRRRRRAAAAARGADGGDAGRSAPRLRMVTAALTIVAIVSLVSCIILTGESSTWGYYSIFTRAWELAVGALVALALPVSGRIDSRLASPLTWLGLACIAVAALTFTDLTPFPGDAALLPVLGAAAVIVGGAAVAKRWSAEAVLGTAPFQRVGGWSYSWYLWHWPVLVLAAAVLGHSLTESEALAMALLSLILAVISFTLIERPIRRMKIFVRRPSVGLAAGAGMVATSLAVVALAGPVFAPLSAGPAVAALNRGQIQLTPAALARDLQRGTRTRRVPSNLVPPLGKAVNDISLVARNGCLVVNDRLTTSPSCVFGHRSSHKTVVLFGDSHAGAWFTGVNTLSKRNHWRLVFLGKSGCPAAEVSVIREHKPYSACVTWRHYAERRIAKLHPALVIVTSAQYLGSASRIPGTGTGHGSTWLNGTAATFKTLSRAAQRVVYIADGPKLRQPGAYCVSAHMSDVRPCMVSRRNAFAWPQARQSELRIARSDGITGIDPASWFCTPTRCPVIVGNILVYRDAQHMTPEWSNFLVPVLAAKIVPVMRAPAAG